MEFGLDLFLSIYENKIDKKGRVSIPSRFRSVMKSRGSDTGSLIVFPSSHHKLLEACDIVLINRIKEDLYKKELFSDEEEKRAYEVFASCYELNVDNDGRVLLPKALLDHANLTDRAIFVGLGDRFQIANNREISRIKSMFTGVHLNIGS